VPRLSPGHPIDGIEQISFRATETARRTARERKKSLDFQGSGRAPLSP
jgi:hypothetical protein